MKKIKAFIQKNIHIIIALVLIISLYNSIKISNVKDISKDIKTEIQPLDSLQKTTLYKIENTTGENLFSLVNTLMKNNERLDSVIVTIQSVKSNTDDFAKELKRTNFLISKMKSDIVKINKELNGLHTNNSK